MHTTSLTTLMPHGAGGRDSLLSFAWSNDSTAADDDVVITARKALRARVFIVLPAFSFGFVNSVSSPGFFLPEGVTGSFELISLLGFMLR